MQQGGHIILAEDEALPAMFLEMILRGLGYSVSTVASGERAVSLFREKGADVLLLDIHLAGSMSGIDAAREIQAEGDIPTVFMTGYLQSSLKQELEGIDTVAFLNKPVDEHTLKNILYSLHG